MCVGGILWFWNGWRDFPLVLQIYQFSSHTKDLNQHFIQSKHETMKRVTELSLEVEIVPGKQFIVEIQTKGQSTCFEGFI